MAGAGAVLPLLASGCAPSVPMTGDGLPLEWILPVQFDPTAEDAPRAAPAAVAAAGDPYAPLAAVLRDLQRGRGNQRGLICMIGDSHAAGPFLVERLRALFQARYGAAGIGRLPPGRAQRYFNPSAFRVDQTGEWASFNAFRSTSPGPFGLTGYRLSGATPGGAITLRMAEGQAFDRLHLSLMTDPAGGSFRLIIDGTVSAIGRTRDPRRAFHRGVIDVPRDSRSVTLELGGDGPVELLGWGVDRRARGIVVEAFGINGATLATLDNRDRAILLNELTAIPPALLILEFGTNEAVDGDLDATAYAAALTRWLRTLRTALPQTGLMLMGPADAGRPRRGSGCAGVAPLPSLARVQAVQREVAARERVAHFDWSAAVTQGPCRLPELARESPPIMQRDLVHLAADGYRLTAERLYEQIIRATGQPMIAT
ncbi:MAG: GDSL-type esterase/lipase family protein [Pseudomonadota bacterium]